MSYDLFFTGKQVNQIEFNAFFKSRKHYTLESGQAFYENERTGVYFSFDHGAESFGGDEADGGGVSSFASFNLNYFRPHTFGLEAEPEVTAFVSYFGCGVSDPQMNGMGEGPYSADRFIEGWNHGNCFGYSAVLRTENHPGDVLVRPTTEIESVWQWNLKEEAIEEQLGMDVFVPTIMYMMIDGQLRTMCVWPDAIPILMPKVDMVYVGRQQLAPKRFLRGSKEDACLIEQSKLDGVLNDFVKGYPLPARHPRSEEVLPKVCEFVQSLSRLKNDITRVSTDSVLNAEMVAEVRAKQK